MAALSTLPIARNRTKTFKRHCAAAEWSLLCSSWMLFNWRVRALIPILFPLPREGMGKYVPCFHALGDEQDRFANTAWWQSTRKDGESDDVLQVYSSATTVLS